MHLGLVDMRALPIAVAIPMSLRAPGEGGSASTNLVDDFVGCLVPDERLGVVVPVLGPELDRFDEGWDAGEDAPFQPAVGEFLEPAFDEVQPRGARGCEVQLQRARLEWSSQRMTSGPMWAERLSRTTWISRCRAT
jgi:hypothetical protein